MPGYHPEGRYEFKIDLDSDAVEDLTYRFVFDERDHNGVQRYTLRRIDGDDAATTEHQHLTRSPKLTPFWTPS